MKINPSVSSKIKPPARGFLSSIPGKTWEEGLLSGNGTIGANILSQPLDEIIVFTHERMYLPIRTPHMPPDQSARLFEIRRLIDRGLYKPATQLQFDLTGQEGFLGPDPFVPGFDMSIKMKTGLEIQDYVRSVNFETGEALVHWSDKNGSYQRKVFVSRADGIAVIQISGSENRLLDCELKLKRTIPSDDLSYNTIESSITMASTHIRDVQINAEGNNLSFKKGFTYAYPGSIQSLEGVARVVLKGGKTVTDHGAIIVQGADEILILLDIKPIYDPEKTMIGAMQESLASVNADYDELLQRHVKLHGDMFNRMKLDIGGGSDHNLTTEELHAVTSNDNINKALLEKQFDAGRYNIISCTGELPPNLQGVWAGTYVPPWSGDFTHNGNLPSAIASMLKGNTPELMLAYTSYLESLVPWLQINARHYFGARGIVLPSRSTTHGYNNALNPNFAGGFWVAGAAWAASFFYDYYLYTGDEKFLADHALPFMEQCGLFFEDYLYEGPDGKYIFSPTQSPENTPGNTDSQGSFNATMDVAVVKELFANLIAASRELEANRKKIPLWQGMLAKMPDYMIDEKGCVKEWLTPRLKNNERHRHASQFYPLYHGMLPAEIASNPDLIEAYRKSINYRLDTHWREDTRGFMSFGLIQLGLAGSSLRDSAIVHECLKHLVNRFWLDNMASMHNHKSLFNMDISGGMPAVIIKMLVASEPGIVSLLPALPPVWQAGEIQGVLCRGQVVIKSLKWTKDQVSVVLLSERDQSIQLEAFEKRQKVCLTAGQEVALQIYK